MGKSPARGLCCCASAISFGCALVETGAETRWSITGESLVAQHRIKPLKGVIVASPANPTGTMMTGAALSELIGCAEDAGIAVISDEIYHGLDYAFPAETAARVSDDVVIINSFSKYFCMTGWRIGWMVLPEPLVRTIDRLQGNLAILPADLAGDFLRFCQLNPKPCPLLAASAPGDFRLPTLADDLDIRTDLPRYRVFRNGKLVEEPTDIRAQWRGAAFGLIADSKERLHEILGDVAGIGEK